MRRRNWRLVIAGAVLGTFGVVFFLFMMTMAPKSNDPVALMQTVGTVSGVVGGISAMMIVIGLIGRKK